MQPIEAIRWMRENPGKVIVAVENEILQFKWVDNVYVWDIIGKWEAVKYNPLEFFAYTYKALE